MSFTHLKIAENRLIETIHQTAKWGAKGVWGPESTQTGVCRLTLSDLDKNVRDWFVEETKSLGCEVKIDRLGNIFAIFPGKNDGLPTAIGSHLDTQPTGGRYDGILGVLSGLEVLRTLKDNGYVPNYPIAVVDWTNEEGARFPMSLMSSSVYAGQAKIEDIYRLEAIIDEPVTVRHELERIGYLGDIECSFQANPIKAHFEIHIEQGPILENENKRIGVVTGVQSYSWNKVKVVGKAQHTGTTPFAARSDALLAASRMIAKGYDIASTHGGLFSVGVLDVQPKVVNVIPNEVDFVIDIRHVDDDGQARIYRDVLEAFGTIASSSGNSLSVRFENIQTSPAIKFNETCIDCVQSSAAALFGPHSIQTITSGAGHDSCATSTLCPTAMIFIPSKDGVSHNPEEYSSPAQVADGLQVLLNAVLRYDSLRAD